MNTGCIASRVCKLENDVNHAVAAMDAATAAFNDNGVGGVMARLSEEVSCREEARAREKWTGREEATERKGGK